MLEALVITLVATVGVCFAFELVLSRPDMVGVAKGFIPTLDIISDRDKLYIAIGILGATVMPHNLYLHSSIVQTRRYEENAEGRREAVRYAFVDSTIALSFALFINAAILIVAAATFHTTGNSGVAEIQDAFKLLTPLLGAGASTVFALALLASGQNSTLTGTLAGQIVMEGFLDIRIRPVAAPADHAAHRHRAGGDRGDHRRRVGNREAAHPEPGDSQPAAIVRGIPAGNVHVGQAEDGRVREPVWLKVLAYLVATVIAALNVWLLFSTVRGWLS